MTSEGLLKDINDKIDELQRDAEPLTAIILGEIRMKVYLLSIIAKNEQFKRDETIIDRVINESFGE